MARRRKGRKAAEPAVTPEQMAGAIADAVAEVVEPIKQKLEDIEGKLEGDEGVKVDEDMLDAVGLDTPEALEDALDSAADLAADTLEAEGNPLAAAVIDDGLDTAQVVEELVKRRKGRKDAGEELPPATAEEIAEVIEDVAEEAAEDLDPEEIEQMADDGVLDEETAAEECAKRRKQRKSPKSAPRSKKSRAPGRRHVKMASTPPVQRKYSGLFGGIAINRGVERPKLTRDEKLVKLARSVKCMDIYPGGIGAPVRDPEAAARAAVKMYGDHSLARELKGMSVTSPSAGGFLVPQDTMDEVVGLLYDETVIFELGARKIPMPHGNLSIPKQTSGARAYFEGEARPIQASQPTLGQLRLSSKRLNGMVVATEELLMSTDYSSDLLFGQDLLEQMKQGVEYGALLAKGTEMEPLGICSNQQVEKINLLTLSDRQVADAEGRPSPDLPIYLRGKVLSKNVRGSQFGWTFNTDMETCLKRMKSDDGKFIWKDEMASGMLDGHPYRVTNLIPTDTTGRTVMIFGLWSDLLVGEQMGLTTRTSYDATIQTEDGQVNLFQNVQTATRATMYIDIGLRHDESFAVATNVKVFG